jgi:hypothetical protein
MRAVSVPPLERPPEPPSSLACLAFHPPSSSAAAPPSSSVQAATAPPPGRRPRASSPAHAGLARSLSRAPWEPSRLGSWGLRGTGADPPIGLGPVLLGSVGCRSWSTVRASHPSPTRPPSCPGLQRASQPCMLTAFLPSTPASPSHLLSASFAGFVLVAPSAPSSRRAFDGSSLPLPLPLMPLPLLLHVSPWRPGRLRRRGGRLRPTRRRADAPRQATRHESSKTGRKTAE